MKDKRLIILGIMIILSTAVSIVCSVISNREIKFRIERAGICNPLKSVEEKEVKIPLSDTKEIIKYWNNTDKEKEPDSSSIVDASIGDYKVFIGKDVILFNLDVNYVSYNGKYVSISDDFTNYLTRTIFLNDKEITSYDKVSNKKDKEKCCSCCPNLKEGEFCIDLCCPCS